MRLPYYIYHIPTKYPSQLRESMMIVLWNWGNVIFKAKKGRQATPRFRSTELRQVLSVDPESFGGFSLTNHSPSIFFMGESNKVWFFAWGKWDKFSLWGLWEWQRTSRLSHHITVIGCRSPVAGWVIFRHVFRRCTKCDFPGMVRWNSTLADEVAFWTVDFRYRDTILSKKGSIDFQHPTYFDHKDIQNIEEDLRNIASSLSFPPFSKDFCSLLQPCLISREATHGFQDRFTDLSWCDPFNGEMGELGHPEILGMDHT